MSNYFGFLFMIGIIIFERSLFGVFFLVNKYLIRKGGNYEWNSFFCVIVDDVSVIFLIFLDVRGILYLVIKNYVCLLGLKYCGFRLYNNELLIICWG